MIPIKDNNNNNNNNNNNDIRTIYIKAKIDNMLQNTKCRL